MLDVNNASSFPLRGRLVSSRILSLESSPPGPYCERLMRSSSSSSERSIGEERTSRDVSSVRESSGKRRVSKLQRYACNSLHPHVALVSSEAAFASGKSKSLLRVDLILASIELQLSSIELLFPILLMLRYPSRKCDSW